MGDHLPHPNIHPQHLSCQAMKSNVAIKNNPSNSRLPVTHSLLFPASISPCRRTIIGNMPSALMNSNFTQLSSPFSLTFADLPTQNASQRRFLIFDQSRDQTRLIFCSLSPPPFNPTLTHKLQTSTCICADSSATNALMEQSDETKVSGGNGGDQMHEDTDEIDALLYSDSDSEDETSTDHSPVTTTVSDEVVASSIVPTKRKRPNCEIDPTLIDTASSGIRTNCSKDAYDNDETSCVKGFCAHALENETDLSRISSPQKRLKTEQIWETVGVLRKIVPGGKEKDTTAVLDKAIQYLTSFKLEARFSGVAL